ncbi:MAG TPA: nitroreductase family deazaflavin-dependent oxidoreductase [Solirubrobacteraceae bacterium]|nr:nitroreductase family deazaflavin-dependent oxidoreductase [Solirubrobacteraceae bacterium]
MNRWTVANQVIRGHTLLYRLSGGLIGQRMPGAPPMLLLDHVGARSGRRRTTPLAYLEEDGRYVIVASKGGYPRHPAWYHNLRAHPETTIQVGPRRMDVTARVASPAERKNLWPKVVDLYSGYANYQQRTDREIPLVILEPHSGG